MTYYEEAASKGLLRYPDGSSVKPEIGDLIVFTNPALKHPYGHVAIITEVGDDYVRTIQQNAGINIGGNAVVRTDPVMRLAMWREGDGYHVQPYRTTNITEGWVRMPQPQTETANP